MRLFAKNTDSFFGDTQRSGLSHFLAAWIRPAKLLRGQDRTQQAPICAVVPKDLTGALLRLVVNARVENACATTYPGYG